MRPKHRKMSMVTRCILITIGIYTLILLITMGSFLYMGVQKGLMDTGIVRRSELEQLSFDLVKKDGRYQLPKQSRVELKQKDRFLMLLDESGKVVYEYRMPKDMKYAYTITEIAGMSRYYYQDYPTYVWEHEAGLMIVGCPKGSVWKYAVDISLYRLDWIKHWFLFASIANVVLVVVVCLMIGVLMQRKSIRRDRRDEARANWITGISHDVRTPLAMILGYAADLTEDPLEPEQKKAARLIKQQALHLRELVSNLNLAMKLDYEMQPLQKRPLLLAKWLRNLVSEYSNNNIDLPYELNLDIAKEAEPILVDADEFLLERLFFNLLNNAVEHNPSGCCIEITLILDNHDVIILITDDGCGNLPKELLQRLNHSNRRRGPHIKTVLRDSIGRFAKRQTAHRNQETYPRKMQVVPEHGLGLKIVKNIADVHNWELTGQNRKPKGCEIRMKIPATVSKT